VSTRQAILSKAFSELGYVETPVNKTKYGSAMGINPAQWCHQFVWWVFKQHNRYFPKTAYCPNGVAWFKENKRWHDNDGKFKPQAGDIGYFDIPEDGVNRVSHVGIFVAPIGDKWLFIEGNTSPTFENGNERNGGQVSLKLRPKNWIVGFGLPDYRQGELTVVAQIVDEYKKLEAAHKPKPVKKTAKKVAK
jgi:hypothetical protein